jgi:hypothetical protein
MLFYIDIYPAHFIISGHGTSQHLGKGTIHFKGGLIINFWNALE